MTDERRPYSPPIDQAVGHRRILEGIDAAHINFVYKTEHSELSEDRQALEQFRRYATATR